MQKLQIERIRTDGGVQSREKISEEYVAELAELIKAGKKLPPIIVYNDGVDMWASDGHHRILAHVRCEKPFIDAEVHKGTKREAEIASCSANQTHGLRRTNVDKHRAIVKMMDLQKDWSDQAIANHVGVHVNTVSIARRQLPQNVGVTRTGIDGITRKLPMPKGNIPPPPPPKTHANTPIPPPPMPKRSKESGLQKDEVGQTIPEEIQPLFDRGHEVKELLQKISEIRTALNRAKSDEDALYGECNFQSVEASLSQAYMDLKATIPYALCPYCLGNELQMKGCRVCGKRGVLGQFRWDTAVPRTMKP
jgi:hypothetical protein